MSTYAAALSQAVPAAYENQAYYLKSNFFGPGELKIEGDRDHFTPELVPESVQAHN